MKPVHICAATVLLLTAPLAAFAQSADTRYCKALGDAYQAYAQQTERKGGGQTNVTADTAVSKCVTAPMEAIPTLEKVLTDAKVSLPPRT